MDVIPWSQVGHDGGWALVAFFVVLVLTGKLKPKSDFDRVEHDRDQWKAESRIKDQQIAEKDDQLRHLAEVGRTVDAIMRAIHRKARRGGDV